MFSSSKTDYRLLYWCFRAFPWTERRRDAPNLFPSFSHFSFDFSFNFHEAAVCGSRKLLSITLFLIFPRWGDWSFNDSRRAFGSFPFLLWFFQRPAQGCGSRPLQRPCLSPPMLRRLLPRSMRLGFVSSSLPFHEPTEDLSFFPPQTISIIFACPWSGRRRVGVTF